MDASLYITMSAAKQQSYMQAAASNNVANAATDNFMADTLAFEAMYLKSGQKGGGVAYTQLSSTGIDDSSGALNFTGNHNDVAASDGHYFVVQAGDEQALVRSATIMHGLDGTLIDSLGRPMLTAEGGPINVGTYPWHADANGTITGGQYGTDVLGRLAVVNVPQEDLTRSELGNIVSESEVIALNEDTARIHTGYKVSSNVDSITEMTRLMNATRNYEMTTKMFNTHKTLSDSASRLIGE